jgi:hypothetical protein
LEQEPEMPGASEHLAHVGQHVAHAGQGAPGRNHFNGDGACLSGGLPER